MKKTFDLYFGISLRNDLDYIGELVSDFFTACAHAVYCKYSKQNYPKSMIVRRRFGNIEYRYCSDKLISTYIDKSKQSVKRWVKYRRLREFQMGFLNTFGDILFRYKIAVFIHNDNNIEYKT